MTVARPANRGSGVSRPFLYIYLRYACPADRLTLRKLASADYQGWAGRTPSRRPLGASGAPTTTGNRVMSKIHIILLIVAGIAGLFYPVLRRVNFAKTSTSIEKQKSKKKTRQKSAKTISAITVISFLVLLAAFGRWNSGREIENLKENKCYTIGKVRKFVSVPKGRHGYEYEFFVNGEKFESYFNCSRADRAFIDKKFRVVYQCDHPPNSSMLIFPSSFNLYNEVFPDSLSWVRQFAVH
jgi:hypothetical protein